MILNSISKTLGTARYQERDIILRLYNSYLNLSYFTIRRKTNRFLLDILPRSLCIIVAHVSLSDGICGMLFSKDRFTALCILFFNKGRYRQLESLSDIATRTACRLESKQTFYSWLNESSLDPQERTIQHVNMLVNRYNAVPYTHM